MNQPLAIPRLSDAIAAELEQRLLERSLKAGDRLPPERKLAADLGVSRASLREAIQILVTRGVLVSRQGGGNFVTDRLETGFLDPWEEMLKKHPSVREDLLEFRHLLESKAAEWAATRLTDADRERLRVCFEKLATAYSEGELEAMVRNDLAFHQTIAEASHNALIGHLTAGLLRLLRDQLRLNIADLMAIPEARDRLMQQHERIWRAIDRQDPAAARSAAEEHIGYVRDNLAEAICRASRRASSVRRLAGLTE